MLVNVRVVHTDKIGLAWPEVKDKLASVIARGDGSITLDETFDGLVAGRQYLVVAHDDELVGCATMINADAEDGIKVMVIGLLWSKPHRFKDWITDLDEVVTKLAHWLDVDAVEIQGRKGWTKLRGFVTEGYRVRRYEQKR
jgi:hypothetical protein